MSFVLEAARGLDDEATLADLLVLGKTTWRHSSLIGRSYQGFLRRALTAGRLMTLGMLNLNTVKSTSLNCHIARSIHKFFPQRPSRRSVA